MSRLEFAVTAQKRVLRCNILAKRRALSEAVRLNESRGITAQLAAWPEFIRAQVIFVYLAMADEPATQDIIELALQSGKTVAVPLVTDARGGIMECARLHSLAELAAGAFGILEPPKTAELIVPAVVDLVLAPGTAFTLTGQRLGMGAGFYDRMFSRMPQAILAGLAFSCQLTDSLPTESHDRDLDYIVMKEGIYSCRNRRL